MFLSKSRIQEWALPEKIFTSFSAVLLSSMPQPPDSMKELGLVSPFLKNWWSFIKEKSGPRVKSEAERSSPSPFLFLKRGRYQASSDRTKKFLRRIGSARFTRQRNIQKEESSKSLL